MIWAKYAAAVVVIAMLYAAYWGIDDNGYDRGRLEVQSEWDKERRQVSEEMLKASIENQKRIAELEKTKNDNLETIDDLRGDVAGLRVRVPKTPCARPDAAVRSRDGSAPSGKPVDTTQEAFDGFRRGLESDAAGADKIIENCRVVVIWAKGLVKK